MHLCKACDHLLDDNNRAIWSFPYEDFKSEPWYFCDCFDGCYDVETELSEKGGELYHYACRAFVLKCPHFKPLDYYRWINSNAYRKKRNEKLKEVGYKCELCGSAKNLQVHHITYDNLGYEPLDDLLVVCRKCHEELHKEDLKQKEDSDCTTLA